MALVVEVFFFFSTVVCGCGGSGWLQRWWVDMVTDDIGLRKRDTEGPFGLNLLLLKLKTENTVAK